VNAMEECTSKHTRGNVLIPESGHFYSNETGILGHYTSAI